MKCNECLKFTEESYAEIREHNPDPNTILIDTYFCTLTCLYLWAHKKYKEEHAID